MPSKSEVIAAKLRGMRAERGLSQRELAEAISVNQTTVSAWENRGGIGLEDAIKIADFYRVGLDELFGRVVPNV